MDNVIDLIGRSPVQHGPRDEMAYLMCLHPADAPLIVENLDQLACTRGYSKVVAKVPAGETRRFLAAGYQLEAALPCFSLEDDAACFMAKSSVPKGRKSYSRSWCARCWRLPISSSRSGFCRPRKRSASSRCLRLSRRGWRRF